MPEVSVNDCRLWYEMGGQGEPLLQIGGAGFAHENFLAVAEDMPKHFTVIDFDLRGYGLSERPEQHYDMDVWADDIAALLDEIGVERTHVHGTSMGGMVAIRLASKYPEKIDGLVLSCTSARSDFMSRARWRVWKELAQAYGMGSEVLALELATQALTRRFLDSTQGSEVVGVIREVLERNCSVAVFSAACDAMAEMDLESDLARIKAPTMVVAGDEDILTPLVQGPGGLGSVAIAEAIPNGELALMRGIAHTNLLEAPVLSVAMIVDFLNRVALSRQPAETP